MPIARRDGVRAQSQLIVEVFVEHENLSFLPHGRLPLGEGMAFFVTINIKLYVLYVLITMSESSRTKNVLLMQIAEVIAAEGRSSRGTLLVAAEGANDQCESVQRKVHMINVNERIFNLFSS